MNLPSIKRAGNPAISYFRPKTLSPSATYRSLPSWAIYRDGAVLSTAIDRGALSLSKPLNLRCQALHSCDLQPGRRQLGRRVPGMVDRPGERISDPRTGRRSALLRPRLGKDHLGRSARGLDATPAAAGDPSAGCRPAAADQRHVHPGLGVRQPRSVAGQPRISRLAAVAAAARE